MPTIAILGRVKVQMFYGDRNPPHVHVFGGGHAALIRIEDGELLEQVMEELRRLKSASAVRGKPYVLRVVWKDGSADTVDMTGVVHRLKAFAPLRDPTVFRKVRVIAGGLGIGWNDDLDYAARSLHILADEQRLLTGADLVAFEKSAGLTTAETAEVLDVAPRTIVSYRRSRRLPRAIASMLRMMRNDPAMLAAHYRPIARPRGRPKKEPTAA